MSRGEHFREACAVAQASRFYESPLDVGLFPLAAFDAIDHEVADRLLVDWGHWLGGCNRPFGRQSFGLLVAGQLVSVAVSASTVNGRCGGYSRNQVVELARLASDPAHSWATRVCLRLWREVAPRCWSSMYWPVVACVSYSNAVRHRGDVYRFDGWERVAEVRGGIATGAWKRKKQIDPKVVWVWRVSSGGY